MTDKQLQERLEAAHREMRKWSILWRETNSNTAFCNMERAEERVIKLETELFKRQGMLSS